MAYLSKYIGKYRVLADYDKNTNDFPREYDGSYSDNDLYITCYNKGRIYHYGNSKLCFYCPSKGRGRNIIKALIADGLKDKIIFIEETDSEVTIKFDSKDIETLEPYFRPNKSGASIRPHSVKNLPKGHYKIPDQDMEIYKKAIAGKEMPVVMRLSNNFIKSIETKKKNSQYYKADMKLKKLKGKDYIHSVGLWEQYIEFIKKM